jgi:hypothetical protein
MFQSPKDKKSIATNHAENAVTDIKNAKNELKQAKNAAVEGIRDEAESFSERAETKVRELRDHARDAGEKVQHFLHDRKSDLVDARDSAERTIKAKPVQSALVAFITGAVLSRLFK